MAVPSKWFTAALLGFLLSLTLMGCKPETPPDKASQTGALVALSILSTINFLP